MLLTFTCSDDCSLHDCGCTYTCDILGALPSRPGASPCPTLLAQPRIPFSPHSLSPCPHITTGCLPPPPLCPALPQVRVPPAMGHLKTLKEFNLRYNNLDERFKAKAEEGLSR